MPNGNLLAPATVAQPGTLQGPAQGNRLRVGGPQEAQGISLAEEREIEQQAREKFDYYTGLLGKVKDEASFEAAKRMVSAAYPEDMDMLEDPFPEGYNKKVIADLKRVLKEAKRTLLDALQPGVAEAGSPEMLGEDFVPSGEVPSYQPGERPKFPGKPAKGVRQRAIQALKDAGMPTTEPNIGEAMRQMGGD